MRLLAALFAFVLTAAAQPSTGQVTVLAVDPSGAATPGTTVTLRSKDGDRSSVAGQDGRVTFTGIPPGRYVAVGRLQGLYVEPATGIVVRPGRSVTVKIELTSDCMKTAEGLDRGLAWAVAQADIIAHVRIPENDDAGACAIESHCTCTLHRAAIVETLKGRPPKDLRFIQEGAGYTGPEAVYRPGAELVVFLKWDENDQAFRRIAASRYDFPVRNGRLPNGQTVAEFEKTLRRPIASQPAGDLTGTVVDVSGGLLPGVLVHAHSNRGSVSTVTDRSARFEFRGLPAGTYTIWTQLAGFESTPLPNVSVTPKAATSVKVAMKTQCLHSVAYVDPGFEAAVRGADLIAHVRMAGPAGGPECAAQGFCTCTPHVANMLLQMKPAGGHEPRDIRLMQDGAGNGGAEPVYRPGDEYIAFLKRDSAETGYSRFLGPVYMLRVIDGRVDLRGRKMPPGFFDGMTVDAFYQILTRF